MKQKAWAIRWIVLVLGWAITAVILLVIADSDNFILLTIPSMGAALSIIMVVASVKGAMAEKRNREIFQVGDRFALSSFLMFNKRLLENIEESGPRYEECLWLTITAVNMRVMGNIEVLIPQGAKYTMVGPISTINTRVKPVEFRTDEGEFEINLPYTPMYGVPVHIRNITFIADNGP